ncbi:tRNA (adenosine(37)-N6)-threonylcarbamoyltransferase complex dimerization subunit type 1 TsaB [Candidatus Saccharibacteria bacterium 32-49-12]|nr:MAG: tRNA (adenosine(37)-N6)-threonylcarbamoyltransferase complex dimerization subunit type 1 TsaB [Candidatus Saccharibacteria bacterium 32-49-12]
MLVALDTSTPVCRLRLYVDGQWESFDWEAGRTLAANLHKHLIEALQDVGMDGLESIHGLIVMRGPGSYTGLRIGLTVANTLAESLAVPIVGVDDSDDWLEVGLNRLEASENDRVVMPEYGGQAHITQPRK